MKHICISLEELSQLIDVNIVQIYYKAEEDDLIICLDYKTNSKLIYV